MAFEDELDVYLRARFTLLLLVTIEEERAVEMLRGLCEQTGRACLMWDAADSFAWVTEGEGAPPSGKDPMSALEQIAKWDGDALFVLKDFHECWDNAQIKRKLRSLAQDLKYTKKSIVVTAPGSEVPQELKDQVVTVHLPLPTAEELSEILESLTDTPGVGIELTDLGQEKLIQAAVGLTGSQARRVFAKAIVTDGKLDDQDIRSVTSEKKQIISESEALEFYAVTETPDNVGGLGVLKEWLRMRERAFSQQARDYGLPAPKGVALIGIPGTGKSLTAKMVAGLWRLPLIRLDMGALYGSLVGESEERARRALHLTETIAPCILWLDEMEKGLATGRGDSGTSTRVFGTILTWMQEKTSPVFVVATANDIAALPPELLRKGRFDEIFFLDLPTFEERREIFAVHLRKRNRPVQAFDLDLLAEESEGYVGAEIEQAVIDAMYRAYNDDMREVCDDDIVHALNRQVPLSISQREIINGLRNWLQEGRALSASFGEPQKAEGRFVPLEIDTERPASE